MSQSNLPTYLEILERVKAQEWGHDWDGVTCGNCGAFYYDEKLTRWCPVRIAQAIKDAMVETFKVSITKLSDAVCMRSVSYADPVYECLTELRETADALEKK